ncbi:uncharacterized protein F5147DRAFT_656528 [Suillus discolor]|uniref:Uncharacterized protein n=1 Tax=Suillus discolor TaxID=1912936 RepID=A0A9P7EXH6_9AGAM|nr:uncharacterized protein F5147DRAFT_656528 [Suillus discolor]KAG2096722.1 hypothetical protein F5147DRAFT_656528 [Suillus discolor]
MIAAAAIVAIYVLSGDKELLETGQTTKIPYHAYHDFYRECLMMGGAWACQVLTFFNQALFPATSSLTTAPVLDEGDPAQSWELDFERAIDEGGEPLVITSNALPASAPPSLTRSSPVMLDLMAGPGMQPDPNPTPIANPAESNSNSTAMQALALVHGREDVYLTSSTSFKFGEAQLLCSATPSSAELSTHIPTNSKHHPLNTTSLAPMLTPPFPPLTPGPFPSYVPPSASLTPRQARTMCTMLPPPFPTFIPPNQQPAPCTNAPRTPASADVAQTLADDTRTQEKRKGGEEERRRGEEERRRGGEEERRRGGEEERRRGGEEERRRGGEEERRRGGEEERRRGGEEERRRGGEEERRRGG